MLQALFLLLIGATIAACGTPGQSFSGSNEVGLPKQKSIAPQRDQSKKPPDAEDDLPMKMVHPISHGVRELPRPLVETPPLPQRQNADSPEPSKELYFRVELLEERGYELYFDAHSTEKLVQILEGNDTLKIAGAFVEAAASQVAQSAGVPAPLSEIGTSLLSSLIESNAETFREELRKHHNDKGVIVSVKPEPRPKLLDPLWAARVDIGTALRRVRNFGKWLTKTFPETFQPIDNQDTLLHGYRRLTWISETPLSAFLGPTGWSVRSQVAELR